MPGNIAKEGGQVVVADVLDGEDAVDDIRSAGGEAIYVQSDVTDEKSMEALARTGHEEFGRNRRIGQQRRHMCKRPILPIRSGRDRRVGSGDGRERESVWLASRAVYPYMKAQGSGKIVQHRVGHSLLGVYGHSALCRVERSGDHAHPRSWPGPWARTASASTPSVPA